MYKFAIAALALVFAGGSQASLIGTDITLISNPAFSETESVQDPATEFSWLGPSAFFNYSVDISGTGLITIDAEVLAHSTAGFSNTLAFSGFGNIDSVTLLSSDFSGVAGPAYLHSVGVDGFVFETNNFGVSVPVGESIQATIQVDVPEAPAVALFSLALLGLVASRRTRASISPKA